MVSGLLDDDSSDNEYHGYGTTPSCLKLFDAGTAQEEACLLFREPVENADTDDLCTVLVVTCWPKLAIHIFQLGVALSKRPVFQDTCRSICINPRSGIKDGEDMLSLALNAHGNRAAVEKGMM